MTSTAGDYLCERFADWGVSTVYGFPGDGINGILGALHQATMVPGVPYAITAKFAYPGRVAVGGQGVHQGIQAR